VSVDGKSVYYLNCNFDSQAALS